MLAKSLLVEQLDNGGLRVEMFLPSASNAQHLAMLAANCEAFDVEIKKHSEARSLTANRYLWKLLDLLSAKLRTDRIELYKECVRKVGLFDDIAILREASKDFIRHHKSKGVAWQIEELEHLHTDKYKALRVYIGSSAYNRAEFSRLVDYVTDECKEQGIDTITENELAKLKAQIGE